VLRPCDASDPAVTVACVSLRDVLGAPLRLQYVAQEGPSQAAQVALREGRAELHELLPPGYRVRASGAAQNLPVIPWLAVLDVEVTTTAQEGIYVAYLFADTLDRVYVSINQGVTAHREYFREQGVARPGQAALQELRRESALLRGGLDVTELGLVTEIHLGGGGFLPRAYEAGSVVARAYEVSSLPDEGVLRADLDDFLALYRDTITIRNQLLIAQPGELHTSTRARGVGSSDEDAREPVFRPKDASDYVAHVPAQTQKKTRKHEDLVKRFGEHARELGHMPSTNVHPRDLVLRRPDGEYLIEAKTVGNNAELAVRDAIGQLFAYRHFWYRDRGTPDPILVALFSEPIGQAFVKLLEELEIAAVWLERGEWRASPSGMSLIGVASG
jgi:hypothetical protein